MKIVMFDTHRYDRDSFTRANESLRFDLTFLEVRLTAATAPLAAGFEAVIAFVNDRLDAAALETLKKGGTKIVALRSAGFNNVDLEAAERLDLPVVRVPEYSPYAVAELAVALLLALNRKIHRAHARVREGNFSLEGLVGFDLHGRTVGLVGTGKIGRVAARIFHGFGCVVLAFDPKPDETLTRELGLRYVALEELYRTSDIISLHVPLTRETHHMIDGAAIASMKPGVLLINTGRGALIDTKALINALKTGVVSGAGLDVYEEEEGVFFRDLSDRVLQDDVLARLMTFPNVLITSHQGFLTREALSNIAEVTLGNLAAFAAGRLENVVRRNREVTKDTKAHEGS